jgi:uncharacterized SAM-binding protein YcdF (DUF218 family)
MFVFSKIFNFLTDPSVVLPVLLALGTLLLWTRWRRAGRGILAVTTGFILFVSVLPVGKFAISILENRFPVMHALPAEVTGIISLGGMINPYITAQRKQPALGSGAERMTALIVLARRYPAARLVFTGGSGSIFRSDVREADAARLFFGEMGLDPGRIRFERESRNTFDNAVFTREMMAPKPGERWVLITSAMHMPRSVGTFRKAGWSPIPYPVDFNTEWPYRFRPGLHLTSGVNSFSLALHEWMGLVIYRILGRSDALFPGSAQPELEAGKQNYSG